VTDDEAIEILTNTCREVLDYFYTIDLKEGTAIERMQRLYKITDHGGDFDKLKNKLVKALTLTHWEARQGNIPTPRSPEMAMGHLILAQECLKHPETPTNIERTRNHLRSALHAIK